MFVRLCVVQLSITSCQYKRRMDFPYKKRTPNHVQIFPKLTELEFRQVWNNSSVFGSHRPQTTSDEDEPKSKFDHFDEPNNFHVGCFLIRGYLHSRMAHAKWLLLALPIRHHVWWCLAGCAICSLLAGLHSNGSNFCIQSLIEMIFVPKSTVSTRRTTFLFKLSPF